MAIIQGIIQVRLGKEIELDKSKLLPGEFGFTTDTRRLFMGSSSGAVELMTKEEFDIPDENIRKEIEEYLSKNPIENDWNNLRNRPFYAVPVDSETAVDIISPMNPANSYGIRKSYSFGIDSDGTWLEIGKPLHIFIDGVEYQLTVEETTIEGVMYRYVGNPHLVGEFPENIPGFNFAIYAKLTDGVVEYHRVYMNTTLPEDSHTIIINEQVLEYHKIPIEYLPDGYGGGTSAEVTAESIKEALGYTPANALDYDELSAAINKKTSTFYVSITESGGNFVADKTMEEIATAHESGSLIFARVLYGDIPIVLSTVMDQMLPEMILFAASFGNIAIGVNIMADNTVSVTMQETALEENVPKKTSQLTNDSEFISSSRANDTYAKKATTLSGYGITDGAKKSGWTPNKHIGTDENGNMIVIETLTESEKEALKQEIIDSIKVEYPDAHVIYGDVDSGNNITIYGELEKGTYTLKYENEDGSLTEIGSLVVGGITNLADPTSADWLVDKRFNSSLGITNNGGTHITNYIPCKVGDVVRVKGMNIGYYGITTTTPSRSRLCMYTDDKSTAYASVIPTDAGVASNDGEVWTYTIANGYSGNASSIKYIRFCGDLYSGYTKNDIIITVNEEIA